MSNVSSSHYLFTSESVSPGHPDKCADIISDSILDAYLAKDSNSRVAVETLVAGKHIVLGGEVRSNYVFSQSEYEQIVKNAQILAETLLNLGYDIVSGGTDTHLVLIDLTKKGISGKKAEITLEEAGITTNKNMVPFDERSPMVTSGIRIGTPAVTTRGFQENEMLQVANLIDNVIQNIQDETIIKNTRNSVSELCAQFPIYEDFAIDEMPQLS